MSCREVHVFGFFTQGVSDSPLDALPTNRGANIKITYKRDVN